MTFLAAGARGGGASRGLCRAVHRVRVAVVPPEACVVLFTESPCCNSASRQVRIVDAGAVVPLIDGLNLTHPDVLREVARGVGNLSANCDFGAMMYRLGVVPRLIIMLRMTDVGCQRMAAMALANIATNVRTQVRARFSGIHFPNLAHFGNAFEDLSRVSCERLVSGARF